MIEIALCDDSKNDIANIQKLILKYAEDNNLLFEIDMYLCGEELIKNFRNQYDIIILDIEMKKINGIDTAKMIREMDTQVVILFSTHHMNYAFDSYKINASDYLLKPLTYKDLCEGMRRGLKNMESRKKEIKINHNGNTRFVELGNVLYLEYNNHKIKYYFIYGEILEVKGSFKEVLKQDITGMLLRIHKNYIVNLIWIELCEKHIIRLKGFDKIFEVSRPKWKEVEETYLRFCHERLL